MRVERNWKHVRSVAGLIPVLALAVPLGCSSGIGSVPTARAAPTTPVVDASGTCPKSPMAAGMDSPICRETKFGNAVTQTFKLPKHRPWGIAWAYACPKPEDFFAVVHMPALDGIMPMTHIYKHGLTGDGYKMETHAWQESYKSTPKIWRDPTDVVVASTCSWHVRVVVGNKATVSALVPAIPQYRKP